MHFRIREGAERSSPSPSEQPHSPLRPKMPGSEPFDSRAKAAVPQTAGWARVLLRKGFGFLSRAHTISQARMAVEQSVTESAWQDVIEAAVIGEVSEYDLFRAAWVAWYGTKADHRETEKQFGACLNGAELPCYIRHFVRQLQCAGNDPALAFDRERFGLDRYRRKEPLVVL